MTCWFNPKGKENAGPVFPDYEISKLDEFESLLKQIFD
jgi:FMN phosphatase YigB (HAD superfamily)